MPDMRLEVLDISSRGHVVAVVSRYSGQAGASHQSTEAPASGINGIRTDLIEFSEGKVADFKAQLVPTDATQGAADVRPVLDEPTLEIDDIQAHVIPGFATALLSLQFFRFAEAERARDWIGRIGERITTCREQTERERGDDSGCVGIAFTFGGLEKLTSDAHRFRDIPFKQGMHRRSALLGDPQDPLSDGNIERWIIGGPQRLPDGVLITGANSVGELQRIEAQLLELSSGCVKFLHRDFCEKKPPENSEHEHFGYLDHISQPGIRGKIAPDRYLTPRLCKRDPNQGMPGQNLVWPGEFLFGYPQQSVTDRTTPGPVIAGGPPWARNGSYLVYRRLRQDVALFQQSLIKIASTLAEAHEDLADLTPERLAAKFMGRWRNGNALVCDPDGDRADDNHDPNGQNDFCYGRATMRTGPPKLRHAWNPALLNFGDPLGAVCPYAAHVRRAYPRDDPAVGATEPSVETHRLLRRGMPFGAWNDSYAERGLAFMAYQSSIERQFEFVTRAWLNNPGTHRTHDGHDPIVGQNSASGSNRARLFKMPVRDRRGRIDTIAVTLLSDWVIPTGGAYLFTPSKSAVRALSTRLYERSTERVR